MSSEIKVSNIKHASSGSNNLVLASDGTTTLSGGLKLPNDGTIGSAGEGGAIKISSVGVVTKPYTPFFRTEGLASSIAQNEYFYWNNATGNYNIGSHFVQGSNNTQNTCSHFLTPIAGVYLFSLSFMANQTTSTGHFHADILIDSTLDTAGTIKGRFMDIKFNTSSSHVQWNGSYCNYIDANQYVKIKLTETPTSLPAGSGDHQFWSGVLLG